MNELSSNQGASAPGTPLTLDQAVQAIEQLQSELNRLSEQLAWTHRLSTLGTLAAALAHEFNNLLTPIGSYAQLALKHPDNPELVTKALHAAATGAAQAGRLADATLGFASPGGSSDNTTRAPACSLRQVVAESLDCLAPVMNREGVKVSAELQDAAVGIDALALQQVLVNLLSNAREALRGRVGSKRVSIKATSNPSQVDVEVSDNGGGIPESVMDRLFEPFVTQRADGSGSGLGLSICKRLIDSVGGAITACSTPGDGTVFHITLPLADASAD